MNGRTLRDSLFLFFLFSLFLLRLPLRLPYYELRRIPRDGLSTVYMKPDEKRAGALLISPSLMIINAWRDEISLMEHNIPVAVCVCVLYPGVITSFPGRKTLFAAARIKRARALSPRDSYRNTHTSAFLLLR